MAYERLIANARQSNDVNAVRRAIKRYQQAAGQFDFSVRQHVIDDQGGSGRGRAAR
jgi:hypothetical protein